ncbi:MAG TPA: urea ABC transporter permease subunit UrtB [Stellaceae bacterium]|jgi:urea transport system permease protein|nr:urea ABC transporter permease subunit UrtB [Stellaceae bacterium]
MPGGGKGWRRWRLPLRAVMLGAVLSLMLAMSGPARAGSDPFSDMASTNFDMVARGVSALAVSGSPRAAPVIDALRDSRLFAWRWPRPDSPLYIRTAKGFVDARTGAPVAAPPPVNVRLVIVNDSVRSAIAAAEGALDLTSPKKKVRLDAAEELYQSAEAGALPLIEQALARERDPAVAGMLREAHAAALLKSSSGSVSARLAAVHQVAARADLSTRSLLESLQGQPPPVAAAIQEAIREIDRRLQLWGVLENVYYGISLGAVLLLAAAGLAITFGVMGVINMAHGEMVMIGAYTTFVVQQLIAASAPALTDLGLLFAVPAAFLVAGMLGVVIERTLIRFLYGRPLETLLATWGLSLILQQAVRSIFGPTNQDVSSPPWMSGAVSLGGLTLTVNRLWIIVFAALVLGALMGVLRWGGLGRSIRAVMQNRRMAAVMGIRTPLIDALTFGLGSGIAGIAGVALSQIDNVSPNLGQNYIIDSFMVVVLGGVGNLWGTVFGAMSLGVVDKLVEPFAGAVLGKILVLVLLILFIQRRPRGLFPLKGRVVEA